jgi:hypothetical protein
MTKPMIRIHDTKTDTVLDREMTDAEFAIFQAEQATKDAARAEEAAKATDKAALLKRLGITSEEATLLLG